MNNLVQTIMEIEPNHFNDREKSLENLRKEAKAMGFYPLPLTWNDIECFWIRLESKSGKPYSVSFEMMQDALALPDLMKAMKGVMKYEGKD